MKQEKTPIYQEITSLNTWIKAVVWLYVFSQILLLPALFLFWQDMQNAIIAIDPSQATQTIAINIDNSIKWLMGAMIFALPTFITSVILIGIWIYRSHKNARALQIQGIKQSPAWAVGGFFVPIANLFVPYQAMKSLVSGSLNALGKQNIKLVGYWWAAWILGMLIRRVSSSRSDEIERALPETPTPEQLLTYLVDMQQTFYLDGISGILLIVSAILLLKIIQTVNQAHREIAEKSRQAA